MLPTATIYFETGEEITILLYPDEAPNTVNNFIHLAEQNFYNYTYINKIVPGYFIQGGDPIGNGYGFPGYFIKSECKYNGVNNNISLTKGVIAMARGSTFNTEGSQFFILTEDSKQLNGQFSAFGKVISGMDVIDTMETVELDNKYGPRQTIKIREIIIDTKGYPYPEPIVISTS
ncbi:hypothetical protein AN640_01485 [Candidatus Epulonipiscium fishelsonii]|uniref:Uncharacterized protein n=1 Tax=Candidatus Epulonipiscium fishelsonii TaxID=77094 RepID=A0ACC8XBY0_9FIRM|nr:hypothetical protein AN640_01485 [Epulopiscium sp. SCG-D08WGA-EpuloA1]OON94806.1 MAG: hypothetical protein ATN32_07875 [Epulopiscium sp. AS2M-Bin002]